jgi:hypothetical protein
MSANDENARPSYPAAIVPHIGAEVTGDKFFPRKGLEEEFDSAMTGGNGAKLFGLRRIGKSSEAAACCERLRQVGYIVVKEDAQGMTSEVALLQAILRQLPADGLQTRVMKLIGDDNAITKTARDLLTKATGGKPEDVLAYFGPIMAAVENAIGHSDRLVLVVDEFPWLCRSILQSDKERGKSRVDVLSAALRRWRSKGVPMLLMGSIGMVALGRQYDLDLSHLNDLSPLCVPPLEPDEAKALVDALAAGGNISGWTEDHTAALLDETVAFYPALLQKGFEQTTLGKRAAKIERFADVFADKVRPDFDGTYYQQFDKRRKLYRELPEPLPVLLEGVLLTVMKAKSPVSWDDLYEKLTEGREVADADLGDALNILREDGFLAVRAQRDGSQHWRPASDLMTAWWKLRRGGSRA